MDDYRQDSSYTTTSGLGPAEFKPLSPQDTTTYRSWRRAVMAFYALVVLLGGIGILASMPASHQEMAQVVHSPKR